MDKDADTLFKDWDENLKKHEKETFQVKPLKTSSSKARLTPSYLFGSSGDKGKVLSIERLHDARDSSTSEAGDDTPVNSSSESVEEDVRRPIYVKCPDTGKKMIRLQFDVQGFESKDIKIKVTGRKLVIFAIRRETDSGRRSTTEFCRKIKLPEDVDVDKLQCSFSEGVLTAEAPVIPRDFTVKHKLNVVKMEQLNCPIIRHTEMGKMMHMFVELGKIFKPDDVVVKLKGHDRLLINAQRQETNENDTMSATVMREFHLCERIYPHSLKAGLTQDGILNVTALVQEGSPVSVSSVNGETNGEHEPEELNEEES